MQLTYYQVLSLYFNLFGSNSHLQKLAKLFWLSICVTNTDEKTVTYLGKIVDTVDLN